MKYPHIKLIEPKEDYLLSVTFDNEDKRIYDVSTLFHYDMFKPLQNKNLFKNVKIETGGYAAYWNKNIDISEYELWKNGINIS